MYKAVIFDYDFTLGDSAYGIAVSCNYALGKLGLTEKTGNEIRRTIGLSLKEVFRTLTGRDDEAAAERFTALFRERADSETVLSTQKQRSRQEWILRRC